MKLTAVICETKEEFDNLTQFRHVNNINEFVHIKTLEDFKKLTEITNVIYTRSASSVSDFEEINTYVNEKGFPQKWQ